MRANRTLLAIAVVIALVATVLALVTNGRGSQRFPVGSPQYVVQQYLQAIVDGDHYKAETFFAPDSKCTINDLDRSYTTQDMRVDLVSVDVTGESALVKVAVGLGSEGPFDSLYVEDHVYRLVKSGGSWLITGIPWPLYDCGMVKS